MPKHQPILKFKIPLNRFIKEMDLKIEYIKRDQTEFLKLGIQPEQIKNLSDNLEDYLKIPVDKELQETQKIMTNEKNLIASSLLEVIHHIKILAKRKYAVTSSQYLKFGFENYNTRDSKILIDVARKMYQVTNASMIDLRTVGLTLGQLTIFGQLIIEFENKYKLELDAISSRTRCASERILKANLIYEIIKQFCSIGQKIWKDKDADKFCNYILLDSVSSSIDPLSE